MEVGGIVFGVIVLIILYFLPSLVAQYRYHSKTPAIFVLNLLLGWAFGIGWVIALVWAFTEDNRPAEDCSIFEKKEEPEEKTSGNLADLEKLAELKEKGIITEEEFNEKKKQILGL